MKRKNWKDEIDLISKNKSNIEIIAYPKNSKAYVYFKDHSIGDDILKQRAERFVRNVYVINKSRTKAAEKVRLSKETIINRINSISSNSKYLSGIETYTSNKSNLKFICSKCNEVYERSLTNFEKNSRCPKCERAKNRIYGKTTAKFKEDVYNTFGEEYSVIGEYINSRANIDLIHNQCGTIFSAPAGRFLREKNFKCPKCFRYFSRGELFIKKYLESKKVNFSQQKSFDGLKLEKDLLFDFYIKDFNTVIEFDGEQHFREIEYFSGFTSFEKVQKSDLLKNQYCKTEKIRLLRIPFWELYNVDKILDTFLENNNLEIEEIEKILESKEIYINREYFEKFKNKKI